MGIKFNNFFREELTINDIQVAMGNGEVTSKELVYVLYTPLSLLATKNPVYRNKTGFLYRKIFATFLKHHTTII